MSSLKIVHGFRPYEKARIGVFLVHKVDGKYELPYGWETKEEEITIIGEDRTSYVYRLQPSEEGRWVGNNVIKEYFILPIGVHKSRLIEWRTSQLSLF